MEVFIYFLIWYIIGFMSFVYHWTKDYDLTTDEIVLAIIVGFFGPTAFIIGQIIHSEGKILIRKRRK